jgi:hypothetical protein
VEEGEDNDARRGRLVRHDRGGRGKRLNPFFGFASVGEDVLLTPLLTPLRALHAETPGNRQQRNRLK